MLVIMYVAGCFKHKNPVSVECKGCKCVLFCYRDDCADDIGHTSICANTPQKRMRNFCETTKYCRSDLSMTNSYFGGLAFLDSNNQQHYFMESHRRETISSILTSVKSNVCCLCESNHGKYEKTVTTSNMKKYNYIVCEACINEEMCGCCFYRANYCIRRRLIVLWFLKPILRKDLTLKIYNLVFFVFSIYF